MKTTTRHNISARPCNLRKTLVIFAWLALLSALSVPAFAYMDSEDQQFKGEIKEAIGRARDFRSTFGEREREETQREHYGTEEKLVRERSENAQEERRRQFIAERNSKPSEQAIKDVLERGDDERKLQETRQMEANRKEYIKKRNDAHAVIEREAHIDENREYGL